MLRFNAALAHVAFVLGRPLHAEWFSREVAQALANGARPTWALWTRNLLASAR